MRQKETMRFFRKQILRHLALNKRLKRTHCTVCSIFVSLFFPFILNHVVPDAAALVESTKIHTVLQPL